ncbi:telethonin-like isoform X2 [Chiloscyllium plagiosum]|uniref:telethonin-like isoform X1 n=2 Tax=Chiloscyllium plagiosum TaxID=36176 RepID=UPI001CB7C3E0|nr:telethonin-like isoform X1 [Chiloscyllium plagiosum]XP_043530624.1 telethonin-like isoform X2 [Chiloscyllium plagiosum]
MELTPFAALNSSLCEGNSQSREFYSAEWEDQIMRTRPEHRCTVSELNGARKESYDRRSQVTYLVQRSPANLMRMGCLGEELTEYRLPARSVLPLAIFTPTQISTKMERAVTPPELRGVMEFESALNGSCQDKREVSDITKELPPVMQPVKLDGKKAGMVQRSLSRSMSQEAQRG